MLLSFLTWYRNRKLKKLARSSQGCVITTCFLFVFLSHYFFAEWLAQTRKKEPCSHPRA
jgi:hypothetical protein